MWFCFLCDGEIWMIEEHQCEDIYVIYAATNVLFLYNIGTSKIWFVLDQLMVGVQLTTDSWTMMSNLHTLHCPLIQRFHYWTTPKKEKVTKGWGFGIDVLMYLSRYQSINKTSLSKGS
jgi:hypothetical protein